MDLVSAQQPPSAAGVKANYCSALTNIAKYLIPRTNYFRTEGDKTAGEVPTAPRIAEPARPEIPMHRGSPCLPAAGTAVPTSPVAARFGQPGPASGSTRAPHRQGCSRASALPCCQRPASALGTSPAPAWAARGLRGSGRSLLSCSYYGMGLTKNPIALISGLCFSLPAWLRRW